VIEKEVNAGCQLLESFSRKRKRERGGGRSVLESRRRGSLEEKEKTRKSVEIPTKKTTTQRRSPENHSKVHLTMWRREEKGKYREIPNYIGVFSECADSFYRNLTRNPTDLAGLSRKNRRYLEKTGKTSYLPRKEKFKTEGGGAEGR